MRYKPPANRRNCAGPLQHILDVNTKSSRHKLGEDMVQRVAQAAYTALLAVNGLC